MVRKILSTTPLAAVLLLCAATGAWAGSFHVYSCHTPAGEVAPADQWSGSTAAGGAFDDYTTNSCGSGEALVAALGDATTHLGNVDRATWTFQTPASARLASATLWRAGYLHGHSAEKATYQFWFAGPAITGVFDECIFATECHGQGELSQSLSASNRIAVPGANLGPHLYMSVSCSTGISGSECGNGFTDPNGYAAAVYLYAADLTLEQTAGPSASAVSGELASAPALSGTSDLAFTATDPGAGVYQAIFKVDGNVVQSAVLDENGGRCRNVGESGDGLPAFLYVQPCLGTVSVDVAFDTTKLSDGAHHLIVSVVDAAGNSAPVLDRSIVVASRPGATGGSAAGSAPGAPNGANASSQAELTVAWKGTRSPRLVTGFGKRETITGRLTAPGGAPIAGAQIDLVAMAGSTGARPQAMTSPRTGTDGSFTVQIPAGASSRTLSFAYRAHLGDPLPVVTRTLTLTVRAALALTISPRTASVGRRIYFSGRLLGGSAPSTGKLLVLEARSPGGSWIKFDVVRSDRNGRYRASYRFRFPGPALYRFRVLAEAEADYPFAAGASNTVTVRES